MDTQVAALLEDLAKVCPGDVLKEEDWEQLYEAALYAHKHGVVPSQRTVKAHLVTHGCSLQKANFLSQQIKHLCAILKLHDKQKSPTAGS